MPLKHICNYPGCNRTVDIGKPYCEVHAQAHSDRQSAYDRSIRMTRDAKLHRFYDSVEWARVVQFINARFKGLCLWSYYHGSIEVSEEVHHILPLRAAWEHRLDVGNLIPLSHASHMMIEAKYRKGDAKAMQRELFVLLDRWNKDFGPGEG